ncbi:ABC transporter substrate-binding protein [Plantibacter flavus]|uniref:ABC transporter substrate-binding protein n=1 Tax=Plantibacter flavus TaxID=150123 RepID=UPI003F190B62
MTFHSRATAVVALMAAAALALTGCSGSASDADASGAGAALTLGSVSDIKSFDPAQAHLGHQMPIYQAAYDTLILRSPEGELEPMLATDWVYNDDQTQLTLTLRDDVTFSDGAEFDADAVKANLDHFREANGPDAAQASSIASVDVVDDTTVTISLSAADPAMTYYLSQAAGFMGSPAALGTDAIVTDPVGSGPYILDTDTSVPGSQFTFTANPDYWNKDLQKYGTVVFKVLTDITARTNALVSGQIDAAILDAKTGKQAEGAGLELTEYPVDWMGLYLFDRDGAIQPALADLRVRQALNFAFDRKTMLEQLALGSGEVTEQVFGKSTEAYDESLNELYPYDPTKAKALLAEAGYADGFTLTLPALPGTEAIMAVIVQQLADIGITVQQEAVPAANYVADISGAKYAAAWFQTFQGEPWVAIKQMIAPNAAYNPFKTTTPELQTMLDAVQAGGDDSGSIAKDVNTYVTENAWFVPFFTPSQMFYSNSGKVTVVPQLQQAVPNLYNYTPKG